MAFWKSLNSLSCCKSAVSPRSELSLVCAMSWLHTLCYIITNTRRSLQVYKQSPKCNYHLIFSLHCFWSQDLNLVITLRFLGTGFAFPSLPSWFALLRMERNSLIQASPLQKLFLLMKEDLFLWKRTLTKPLNNYN